MNLTDELDDSEDVNQSKESNGSQKGFLLYCPHQVRRWAATGWYRVAMLNAYGCASA